MEPALIPNNFISQTNLWTWLDRWLSCNTVSKYLALASELTWLDPLVRQTEEWHVYKITLVRDYIPKWQNVNEIAAMLIFQKISTFNWKSSIQQIFCLDQQQSTNIAWMLLSQLNPTTQQYKQAVTSINSQEIPIHRQFMIDNASYRSMILFL